MVVQIPVVLYSGGHYPRGFRTLDSNDTVPGTDTTAQASGNAALVLAGTALASGNAGISTGLTALASGNAGISTGLTALASGNAGISIGLTAQASGNAALSLANLKLPLSGGVLTGDVILDNQVDARFREATASGVNYVGFQAPANIVSDILFTLPSADGTNGQVLGTNGSGVLSFSTLSDGDIISEGNTSAEVIDTGSDGRFVVTTEGSERARIDSSGRLLVGTTSARSNLFNATASAQLQSEGTTNDTSTTCLVQNNSEGTDGPRLVLGKSNGSSVGSNTIVASGNGLGIVSFQGNDGSEFVDAASIKAEVDGTPGADDMPGRLVFSTTADGASTPTERMRITSEGDVLIGKTIVGINTNTGTTLFEGGAAGHTVNGNVCLYLNRLTSDGTLAEFRQANTTEGTISVNGTTVSYNGAHLSRWSQLPSGAERTEILRGSVLSNIDEMCEWGDEDNEQLNRMKVSDVEGDKNVSGVFQDWDDDDDTYTNDFYCAMTGDFIIRIAEGVTVERGDLLMSAGDGTARPQDDDIICSKTIAKVTSTNVSCTYDDGSYCVPCVLMAC